MRQIYLILCILLVFTSCDNDDLPQSDVRFSVIGKGDSFPTDKSTAQRHLVINDIKSWNSLKKEMNTSGNLSKSLKETNIDFNTFQIIAVIDKNQGNGGHSIDIVTLNENRNTIIVKVEKLKNGNSSAKKSRPYDIIKIAKTDKKIVFEQ